MPSRFASKNRYNPSRKKKNGKIFLLSAIISIVVMSTLVTWLTDPDLFTLAQKTDLPKSTKSLMTSLNLPEIGYQNQSEVVAKAVIYTEPQPEFQEPPVIEAPIEKIELPQVTTTLESNAVEIGADITSTDRKSVVENSIKTVSTPETVVADTAASKKNQELTKQLLVDTLKTVQNLNQEQQKQPEQTNQAKIQTDLPNNTISIAQEKIAPEKSSITKNIVVKKGDTLSAIFKKESLSSSTLYKIINSGKQAKKLTRIKPGQTFTIVLNDKNDVESLKFDLNKVDTLVINKQDKQFISHIESKDIDIRRQFTSGTITNSLFSSAQKAGLNSSMIMKLAHVFGWDIDFALDIRKGDSFAVLYEENYIDDKKISSGNILSAEFVNNGKVFKAVRYTDASGHTDYYSEKGLSMRKAFLRTPVEFSRISSKFSTGRRHPVLNKIRAHKGVDYAASRGTPIKAVGDGKVSFKGKKGGYGRVIILQHGAKYTTLYAHMNSYNRKLRHGSRVKQGQTIGYVGSSGLATGPHLHYEFRVNGVHRNPLTVALPSASPISKKYRADFQVAAETLISQLKLKKLETVALKDE